MTPIETVLEVADGARKSGSGWSAKCPAHEDRRASLSITEGTDGKVLLFDHAGCPFASIVKAWGLEENDLFPPKDASGKRIVAEYTYTDEAGTELYQAVRFEPKDFRQRHRVNGSAWEWNLNGTRRVLYRLPELLAGGKAGARAYVVEGEKDVDALRSLGLVATCNPMGAGKWRDEYAKALVGAHVRVIADKDKAGRDHADQVAASLQGKAASVCVVEVPDGKGKDAADFIASGASAEDFEKLAAPAEPKSGDETPPEEPDESSPAEIIRRRGALNCERHATGIPPLDSMLSGGMPAGRSLYVVAPMEAGKTSLADFMGYNMAKAGLHVGGLWCDEGRDAASVRFGQMLGLERDLLERGDPETADRFDKLSAGLSLDFMETDSEKATIEELFRRGARRSGNAVSVNIVDSLQRTPLDGEKPGMEPRLKVRATARACAKGGGPRSIVIATAQANRASYAAKREQDRIRPEAAGAESSEVEFAADVQLFLEAVPDSDLVRVKVTKNRVGFRGEKGTFFLRLNRARATYSAADGEDVASVLAEQQASADEQRADAQERRDKAQSEKAESRVRQHFAEQAQKGIVELPAAEVRRHMRVGTALNRELLKRWADTWLHGRKNGKSKLFHVVPAGKESGQRGCCPGTSANPLQDGLLLEADSVPHTLSSPLSSRGEYNVRDGSLQPFTTLSQDTVPNREDSEDSIAGEPDEETV